jgi:hypothetical protein
MIPALLVIALFVVLPIVSIWSGAEARVHKPRPFLW